MFYNKFLKKKSLKNSLKYSTIEGSMWAFMYGMGENYLAAMSVLLGYTAVQISLLNSFPHLIYSIVKDLLLLQNIFYFFQIHPEV